MSARKRRTSTITESIQGLVEAVTERVLLRVQRAIPDRTEVLALRRELKRLARRVESRVARPGARKAGRPPLNRKCKVGGCGLPHIAQGFCSKHYQAWRRRKRRSAGSAS